MAGEADRDRAGDVRLFIFLVSPVLPLQVKTAIGDDPRARKVFGERGRGNEGGVGHGNRLSWRSPTQKKDQLEASANRHHTAPPPMTPSILLATAAVVALTVVVL